VAFVGEKAETRLDHPELLRGSNCARFRHALLRLVFESARSRLVERETRLELATSSLEGMCSDSYSDSGGSDARACDLSF